MNIPKFWAKENQETLDHKGNPFLAQCWRWSNSTYADAKRRAAKGITEIARRARTNEPIDRYLYGERPLREEIIETVGGRGSEPLAIITRNAYGTLVLNTARVMLVDIDFQSESLLEQLMKSVKKLLGQVSNKRLEEHVERLEQWTKDHPDWGMRIYRTRAGLRCLVTHALFDPSQRSTIETLRNLGSDPLYVALCKYQESFQARLTPKPWRCGTAIPPNRYPWENDEEEKRFRSWENRYHRACAKFTTCELVAVIGHRRCPVEVEKIQAVHDQYTCSSAKLTLA